MQLSNRAITESIKHCTLAGVKVQPEVKAKDDVTEVDGVKIYEGKYAMNDEGKVLSPSAQKVSQLKAELTARGLSTKGKSAELKRRVMVSSMMSS